MSHPRRSGTITPLILIPIVQIKLYRIERNGEHDFHFAEGLETLAGSTIVVICLALVGVLGPKRL